MQNPASELFEGTCNSHGSMSKHSGSNSSLAALTAFDKACEVGNR